MATIVTLANRTPYELFMLPDFLNANVEYMCKNGDHIVNKEKT